MAMTIFLSIYPPIEERSISLVSKVNMDVVHFSYILLHLATFDYIWLHLATFGYIWLHLTTFGYI